MPKEETGLIVVTQLPVIEERLREVKAQVEQAVEEAKSLIATADTVQAVKNRRAELNKQFDALEAQRKAVKEQIMAPYDRFNQVYKECIEVPFKDADRSLKATVDEFENDLKTKTIEKIKDYYAELCTAERIDWLPFERAMQMGNIKVSMADTKANTPRRLMDALGSVVATVATATDQITKMEDAPEIMAEYKLTLDVGKAVANVQGRKRMVKAEKERAEQRAAEEARQAERIARVEAAAPPEVRTPTAPPEVFPEFRFTVYNCTRTQLIKIREFLKTEGIAYGK